jgi:hypothetical protein
MAISERQTQKLAYVKEKIKKRKTNTLCNIRSRWQGNPVDCLTQLGVQGRRLSRRLGLEVAPPAASAARRAAHTAVKIPRVDSVGGPSGSVGCRGSVPLIGSPVPVGPVKAPASVVFPWPPSGGWAVIVASPLPGAGAVLPHLGRLLLNEVEESKADPGIGDLLAVDRIQVPAVEQ